MDKNYLKQKIGFVCSSIMSILKAKKQILKCMKVNISFYCLSFLSFQSSWIKPNPLVRFLNLINISFCEMIFFWWCFVAQMGESVPLPPRSFHYCMKNYLWLLEITGHLQLILPPFSSHISQAISSTISLYEIISIAK